MTFFTSLLAALALSACSSASPVQRDSCAPDAQCAQIIYSYTPDDNPTVAYNKSIPITIPSTEVTSISFASTETPNGLYLGATAPAAGFFNDLDITKVICSPVWVTTYGQKINGTTFRWGNESRPLSVERDSILTGAEVTCASAQS